MKVLAELERLRWQPMEWAGHPAIQRTAPKLALSRLIQARDTLVARRGQLRVSTPPMNCSEASRVWESCSGNLKGLTSRQIRGLCRCSETALKPELIRALASHDRAPTATLWLASLVATYFERWRAFPLASDVESGIRQLAAAYRGRSSVLNKYKDLANELFSSRAAEFLAERAFARRCASSEVLSELGIPSASGLAKAAADKLVDQWIQRWKWIESDIGESAALDELRFLAQCALTDSTAGDPLYKSIDAMVLGRPVDRYDSVKQFVRTYVIKRLGDPRLPSMRAAWTSVSPKVRQRVLSWLAREYLLFFFETVLPNAQDDHGRKDFWLRYCDRLVDFNVALSRRDELRVKAELTAPPPYARLDEETMSAFIMRFTGSYEDVVVVEFSETGNAAYIHQTERFLQILGSIHVGRFKLREHLRHDSKLNRILHQHGWQWRAASQLATYGIR